MSNCISLFVMVAGLSINPCHVASMEDYKNYDETPYCIIVFDTGNAWDGQHVRSVDVPCSVVQQAINDAIRSSK